MKASDAVDSIAMSPRLRPCPDDMTRRLYPVEREVAASSPFVASARGSTLEG
jgi:hypothetical protein